MILTAGPSVTELEEKYVLDACRNGWNEQWNKYIVKFEKTFADFIGRRFAISTSSCTGALHMNLVGLGIGAGDEVIIPELTWVATASAVKYVGATPVFCDVQEDSWCMCPKSLESRITEKTKAIIPVHLYGHPAKMDEIMAIAKKYNLKVIEDAAPSVGAEFMGKRTGSFGDSGCFSFQGAKVLVTGEGGMFLTDDENLYEEVFSISNHGRDKKEVFWINRLGFKYKMSNLQAAFGLAQLERVDELVAAKRQIFDWYKEDLNDAEEVVLNYECPWAKSIYWMASIRVKPSTKVTRDEMMDRLRKSEIDTRPVFPTISKYPMWQSYDNPIAEKISMEGLNLPSGVCLTREQVSYVCQSIKDILAKG